MVKYLGSKRKIIPEILDLLDPYKGEIETALDLFSGTTRVGQALRSAGIRVISNDIAPYSFHFGKTYLKTPDTEAVRETVSEWVAHMNGIDPIDGWFTETYCRRSRFFEVKNGQKIDAIRKEIERRFRCFNKNPVIPGDPNKDRYLLRSILLTSLIEAADRVDSTCGVQMAYLKSPAARANNDLTLRVPLFVEGPLGEAGVKDAHAAADQHCNVDLAYIDPPYNQHSYMGNYHIWHTLSVGDEPEVYGVACKRVDCKTNRSIWNSKPKALENMERLVASFCKGTYLLFSLSDEGYLTRSMLESILDHHGRRRIVREIGYDRYVGAKIGIHNPQGQRVGAVSHLRNTEYLVLALPV